MEAKLLKHRGMYYLYLDYQTIIPMREEDILEFLKNYADYRYYNDLIIRYSASALKRRFSREPEVLAILNNKNELLIKDPSFLITVLSPNKAEFISIDEYAKKHGKKRAIVARFCRDGRIPGAKRISNEENKNAVWLIPANAPYPEDKRKTADSKLIESFSTRGTNNSWAEQSKVSKERNLFDIEE